MTDDKGPKGNEPTGKCPVCGQGIVHLFKKMGDGGPCLRHHGRLVRHDDEGYPIYLCDGCGDEYLGSGLEIGKPQAVLLLYDSGYEIKSPPPGQHWIEVVEDLSGRLFIIQKKSGR